MKFKLQKPKLYFNTRNFTWNYYLSYKIIYISRLENVHNRENISQLKNQLLDTGGSNFD